MLVHKCTLPNGFRTRLGQDVRSATLRQLSGVEEDILVSEDKKGAEALLEVVKSCIVGFNGITDMTPAQAVDNCLLEADLAYLLLTLRIISVGETYRWKYTCPECKKVSTQRIDLDSLRVDKQDEKYFGRIEHDEKYLDDSGREHVVSFRLAMASDIVARTEIKRVYPNEIASRNLALQVLRIDGEPSSVDRLRRMTMRERARIREIIDTRQGGVDHSVEVTCPYCKEESKARVEGNRDFFSLKEGTFGTKTEYVALPSGSTPSSSLKHFHGPLS